MVANKLCHNWKTECFSGGYKSSSKIFILFDLVCRLRFDLLVSQMLTIGLENSMHLRSLPQWEHNHLHEVSTTETEIHRRLPNNLLELKAVSSPEVLHMLPSLWYHWCSAVTQNCMSQDCQSYRRVPLSMSIQLFSARHKWRLEFAVPNDFRLCLCCL